MRTVITLAAILLLPIAAFGAEPEPSAEPTCNSEFRALLSANACPACNGAQAARSETTVFHLKHTHASQVISSVSKAVHQNVVAKLAAEDQQNRPHVFVATTPEKAAVICPMKADGKSSDSIVLVPTTADDALVVICPCSYAGLVKDAVEACDVAKQYSVKVQFFEVGADGRTSPAGTALLIGREGKVQCSTATNESVTVRLNVEPNAPGIGTVLPNPPAAEGNASSQANNDSEQASNDDPPPVAQPKEMSGVGVKNSASLEGSIVLQDPSFDSKASETKASPCPGCDGACPACPAAHGGDCSNAFAKIREELQRRIQVKQQMLGLVENYNRLAHQDRWAEAELIGKQAKELDPQNPVAIIMFEKARINGRMATGEIDIHAPIHVFGAEAQNACRGSQCTRDSAASENAVAGANAFAKAQEEQQRRIEAEQQMSDLVEDYNGLVKQNRWAEAEMIAKQAKELDRDNPLPTMMYEKARVGRKIARGETLGQVSNQDSAATEQTGCHDGECTRDSAAKDNAAAAAEEVPPAAAADIPEASAPRESTVRDLMPIPGLWVIPGIERLFSSQKQASQTADSGCESGHCCDADPGSKTNDLDEVSNHRELGPSAILQASGEAANSCSETECPAAAAGPSASGGHCECQSCPGRVHIASQTHVGAPQAAREEPALLSISAKDLLSSLGFVYWPQWQTDLSQLYRGRRLSEVFDVQSGTQSPRHIRRLLTETPKPGSVDNSDRPQVHGVLIIDIPGPIIVEDAPNGITEKAACPTCPACPNCREEFGAFLEDLFGNSDLSGITQVGHVQTDAASTDSPRELPTVTRSKIETTLATYPLRDLVLCDESGHPVLDTCTFIDHLQSAVAPESWSHPSVSIQLDQQSVSLVVRQTPEVQKQIEAHLRYLRRLQVKQLCNLIERLSEESDSAD